ncbi:Ig-like domain-containing protein [Comamonas odontotermitis]|uniref:Ig-like domain-containing protein n=1 Tax=Comamonas odontotermitis TaxID=379895 RepID=UPI003750267D
MYKQIIQVKIPNLRNALALMSGVILAASASAATTQVSANSNYFNGWQFNTSTSPGTGCISENTSATTVFAGTLGSGTFQLAADASPTPEQWQNCPIWTFGQGMPAGIGAPPSVSAVNIRRGNTQYTFPQALPVGTTFFVQDLDAQESVNVSFLSCSGQAIDASGFDLLRVSNPSATTPSVTPGASWSATRASLNASSPNELFGITIRDSSVCSVRLVSTANSNSGGELFFFGLPAATVTAVDDTGTTTPAAPITVDLRANDFTNQPGYVSLNTPTITTQPTNGTVSIDGSGNAVYTPNANFTGTDTFKYQVCTQTAVPQCAQATVAIAVNAVPPAPPVINDASHTTPVNTPVNANAGSGGQVPPGSAFQTAIPPAHGQLTIDPTTGAFTYTPSANYAGTDTATVRVCLPAPNSTVCDDAVLTFNVQGGGGGSSPTSVPTLGGWTLIGLTTLVAMLGFGQLRRLQR